MSSQHTAVRCKNFNLDATQPILHRLPLLLLQLRHLLLCHIITTNQRLVERVIWVFLKLLAYLLNFLIPPQSFLIRHLLQPPFLERRISRLEPSLRMSINLVIVA